MFKRWKVNFRVQLSLKGTLSLHQQLKLDNSQYIVPAKHFVLIIEYPAGQNVTCVRCSGRLYSCKNNAKRLGFLHCNATTSHFKMAALKKFSDQNNHLAWMIKRELLNLSFWCRYKLRKILIRNWYCWTAEVPFKELVPRRCAKGRPQNVELSARTGIKRGASHLVDMDYTNWASIPHT